MRQFMWKEAVAPAKWLGLAAALALCGCSTINGYLEPVPTFEGAPGTTHVEMVVATTRTRSENPALLFGGGRAAEPAFADMVVSIPPDANRTIGQVQWPKQLPGNPETDFVTLKADVINKDQAIATFDRLLRESNKSEAMVYVHGFNERYENTVYGFAQILHDSGALGEVAPVLFTWPSKGNVFAYGYDRESANYSRDALERLLQYLAKEPKVKKITILAHSMGNWVTLEALRQMAIRDKRIDPKIALVLLADPDVDVDVSREQIAAMGPNRPHIALFVSEDDRALAASKQLWGAPRLGAINPDIEPYKSMLERENITVINLTAFPSHDSFNHGKFAEDPKVVELIGRSLANGQALTNSQVGFGEKIMETTASAATSVGHAAGLAISAPVAIVDPETREHLGDQVDVLTDSVAHIGPQKEP
ncbi:alpha/beta hydrolase [Methylocella sp.]|jgi:esterase/lipase superfamily enzyme|uniref:alpha/beta hydrolase n=1 Tax=Methylocella sp. TaxID=1978226 RepID=UPI003C24FDD5